MYRAACIHIIKGPLTPSPASSSPPAFSSSCILPQAVGLVIASRPASGRLLCRTYQPASRLQSTELVTPPRTSLSHHQPPPDQSPGCTLPGAAGRNPLLVIRCYQAYLAATPKPQLIFPPRSSWRNRSCRIPQSNNSTDRSCQLLISKGRHISSAIGPRLRLRLNANQGGFQPHLQTQGTKSKGQGVKKFDLFVPATQTGIRQTASS